MEIFCNLLHSFGVPSAVIQTVSWCICAVLLFLGIFGMGIAQGRFNYLDL